VYSEGLAGIRAEVVLVLSALAVLVIDLFRRDEQASRWMGRTTIAGLLLTGFLLLESRGDAARQVYGLVTIDRFGNFFKLFTVAALLVVVWFVMSDRRERKTDLGEYYFLLLGAAVGIFFMVGTNNLLLLVLALELLSLASYSLAGYHKGEKRSAEAAMKYVVFGGLSAGIMVYGISLLYGLTGTIDLSVMAGATGEGVPRSLASAIAHDPAMVAIAITLILAGFAYKISVAPFHFWAPDVYEGAPTPVTTFLAVASKAAGFGALLRFLAVLFAAPGTQAAVAKYGLQVGQLLAVLSAVTMTLGNLAALRQESVKRMLAYSSVAHAGYALMGVVVMNQQGFEAALYYLAAYYFMNLGAFGFLLYFHGATGKETYDSLRGMGWRAPAISIAMVVFLISLTGIPPTIGFYGKLKLFYASFERYPWLVVIAGLNSVVSLFYYIKVAAYLFLADPAEETPAPQPVFVGLIVALAAVTVIAGVYVSPLVNWAAASLDILATR
jgi:NADH-quinone oxidoreductase subunit N